MKEIFCENCGWQPLIEEETKEDDRMEHSQIFRCGTCRFVIASIRVVPDTPKDNLAGLRQLMNHVDEVRPGVYRFK